MAWKPKQESNFAPRELIPVGTHEARCYGLVDLGTHPRPDYLGKPKSPAQKIMFFFEFPELKKVFKEENGEEPMVKHTEFTFIFGDNSNLVKTLKPWIGDPQLFDLARCIGMPAQVKIVHTQGKKDPSKTYDNIETVAEMSPKLIKMLEKQHNPNMVFNIDEHGFDSKEFSALYEWLKKIIMESLEYKEYLNGPAEEEPATAECPFPA